MAGDAGVSVDLPVVAALEGLVAEKVDGFEVDAGQGRLGLQVTETVSLVPAHREDVEGDLAADRITIIFTPLMLVERSVDRVGDKGKGENVRQSQIGKFLLQRLDHGMSTPAPLVPGLELVPFLAAGITPHRTHVDHARAKLHEGAAHGRQARELGNVFQAEFDQALVLFFPEPLDE